MTKFKKDQDVRLKARPDIVLTVVKVNGPNDEIELIDDDGNEYWRYKEELEVAPRKLTNGDVVLHPSLDNLTFIGWLKMGGDIARAVCWQSYPLNDQLKGEIRIILSHESLTADDHGPIDWGA